MEETPDLGNRRLGRLDRPDPLSRAVYRAAAADAHWALIENADHNDPTLSYGQPLMETIDQFLDQEH